MQPSHEVAIHMQPFPDGKDAARDARVLQVKDHVLWSLLSFVFANFCCLGFVALLFSVKSRDRKVIGDVEGASLYGRKAKCLNIIVVILSVLFLVVFIALIATGKLSLNQKYASQQNSVSGWNK